MAALARNPAKRPRWMRNGGRLQAGTRIRDGVAQALALLGPMAPSGRWPRPPERLAQGAAAAEGLLDESLTALDRARDALAEATRLQLPLHWTGSKPIPPRWSGSKSVLFALRAAHRKYRCDPEAPAALAADMAARVAHSKPVIRNCPRCAGPCPRPSRASAECAVLSAARTAAAAGLERGVARNCRR